jgi:hypothetical protein
VASVSTEIPEVGWQAPSGTSYFFYLMLPKRNSRFPGTGLPVEVKRTQCCKSLIRDFGVNVEKDSRLINKTRTDARMKPHSSTSIISLCGQTT